MLDLLQAGERRVADLREGTSGTLSLCAVHTAPLYYLAEVLRDFRLARTGVQARVQIGEREELIQLTQCSAAASTLAWTGGLLHAPE